MEQANVRVVKAVGRTGLLRAVLSVAVQATVPFVAAKVEFNHSRVTLWVFGN